MVDKQPTRAEGRSCKMMRTVKRRLVSLEERTPHRVTSDWLFGRLADLMRLAGLGFEEAFRSVVVEVSTEDLRRILEEIRAARSKPRGARGTCRLSLEKPTPCRDPGTVENSILEFHRLEEAARGRPPRRERRPSENRQSTERGEGDSTC